MKTGLVPEIMVRKPFNDVESAAERILTSYEAGNDLVL
jgi:hypothetical protein